MYNTGIQYLSDLSYGTTAQDIATGYKENKLRNLNWLLRNMRIFLDFVSFYFLL